MPKGIFITGTDTGVGKTVVAATIARYLVKKGLSVGVLKPVTSGAVLLDGRFVSSDAQLLAWAADCGAPEEDVSPFVLREPLAPSEAASREGITIETARIRESFDRLGEYHDYVVVEGAGGLLVPLADNLLVADLVLRLELPLLIVARPGLGTVNHTLMTCECANARGIPVSGIIINRQPEQPGPAEEYASRLIERFSGHSVLGVLPDHEIDDEKALVEILSAGVYPQPLADFLTQETGI